MDNTNETKPAAPTADQRADLQLKRLNIAEKKQQIAVWENQKLANDIERIKLDKIRTLTDMLQSLTIDPDQSPFGSDPKFVKVFNGQEEADIRRKLMNVVKSL